MFGFTNILLATGVFFWHFSCKCWLKLFFSYYVLKCVLAFL
uniref:Uncharacterized protein n=1 Tax=Anguilla anguilla TaxID=7936 RepID=A0A0E9RKD3_ANGAN